MKGMFIIYRDIKIYFVIFLYVSINADPLLVNNLASWSSVFNLSSSKHNLLYFKRLPPKLEKFIIYSNTWNQIEFCFVEFTIYVYVMEIYCIGYITLIHYHSFGEIQVKIFFME